jgi:glycosyltransferase involved in cell wall biosynthesis
VREQVGDDGNILYFPNSAEQVSEVQSDIISDDGAKWVKMMQAKFAVVFTGNVGTAQSMHTIVDSAVICAVNPNICFFIVGMGSQSKWLENEVQTRGITNIVITGMLPETDMPYIWNSASVLLVTLLNIPIYHQTIPNKLQCYLAAGKPIAACLAGEGARVVNDSRSGLVCEPEDSIGLASCLCMLFSLSDTERLELGRNGKRYFDEHFDPKTLTTHLIRILDSLNIKKFCEIEEVKD